MPTGGRRGNLRPFSFSRIRTVLFIGELFWLAGGGTTLLTDGSSGGRTQGDENEPKAFGVRERPGTSIQSADNPPRT